MQACTIESMKTMDFMSTVSPEILRTLILPWDIETFVIFAVKAQEYNNLDIRDKNGKYFYEIMQSINIRILINFKKMMILLLELSCIRL